MGQKKTLSLTYDTNMKIDVYLENPELETKVHYATYTIKGIDDIASNDVSKKEGSSKPKIYLNFELTRSGLLQLNKAEAKVDEMYEVEQKAKKTTTLNTESSTEKTEESET